MFVPNTVTGAALTLRSPDDIRAEIATLKEGLAVSLNRGSALEAARTLLEPFDDDITNPILTEIEEGNARTDEEIHRYCREIMARGKELTQTWLPRER